MQLSSYNIELTLENDDNILYNTLTRKYVLFNRSMSLELKAFLKNINSGEYSLSEFEVLKKLIQRGIIIKDNENELDKLKYIEKRVRFNQDILYLVIQPTLDCNFRCTYCYEKGKIERMDSIIEESIVKYIENNASQYKKVWIGWFGGEPLLEFDRIESFTHKIKKICNMANVGFGASMTTNAYLFTDTMINKLKDLSIRKVQITLDGNEESHNRTRPLIDGSGTYRRILHNLNKIAELDLIINLRINITEDNYLSVNELIEEIPIQKRNKIRPQILNLFQASKILNPYAIYKTAIEKGYDYNNTKNKFYACEVCKSALIIEPSGRVAPCSMAAEQGYYYGIINEDGVLVFNNKELYYKINNATAFNNEKCAKCNVLPMCMGGCKFARSLNSNICNVGCNDGLSVEEKIKLHYYLDLKNGYVAEDDSITI